MKRNVTLVVCPALILILAVWAWSEQTILRAYAPADSDGTSVILEVDWSQVKAAAPEVDHVSLRRRPAHPPAKPDTIAILPVDSARFIDAGLDPRQAYHYYAYFKDADSSTLRFGSFPAVVHLGPIHTMPGP